MNPIFLLVLLAVSLITIFSVSDLLKRWFVVFLVWTILIGNLSINNTFELFQMPLQVATYLLLAGTAILGYKAFATERT